MSIQLDLMPPEEKPPEAPPARTLVVRYGYLREIGEFPSDLTQKAGCGTKLVVRTDRGTEIAELLTTTCGNGGCGKSITRDKLLEYIELSGGRHYPFTDQGRVLRVATSQDLLEQSKLDENRQKHVNMARELVQTHRLAMKIVEVEHLLGGERIMFYFVSEHRIDFRTLVRDLAHSLHTRIELRQVGARDEARLTADYEKCGQHCCCKQFLKVLTPISMRAAKVQKATLDPTKISGRCGRLMCCLRYEDQTYEELRKKLPKRNTRVRTEKGDAWVIDGQILTQLVLCQLDDGTREAIPMEKILEFDRPKPALPDGRIMQTPNDRPPMMADPRRGGPNSGPPGAPPRRPRPGSPMPAPQGDPRALSGPTGGDLGPPDEFDDLIADAMDDAPIHPGPAPAPAESSAAPANPPVSAAGDAPTGTPAAPRPPQSQAQRPPMNPPRPGQRPPQNRPQQQQRGGRPPQNQPRSPGGPPQGRGPQFRNQPPGPPQNRPPQGAPLQGRPPLAPPAGQPPLAPPPEVQQPLPEPPPAPPPIQAEIPAPPAPPPPQPEPPV